MAQDNEIRLQLTVESNDSSIANAKNRLREIEVQQRELAESVLKGNRSLSSAQKEIDGLTKEYSELNRVLQKTGQSYETIAQEAKRLAQEQERAANSANDQFDDVSRRVALAGDAESNLRTIGGAIGAFGGSGAEQAIGTGAEVFAVAEAFPRLKASLQGIPSVIGELANSLGLTVPQLGIATAGIIGFTVALQALQAAERERTEFARATTDALLNENNIRRESNEALLSLATEYSASLRDQSEDLQTAKGALTAFEEGLGEFRGVAELGNVLGAGGTQLGVLRSKISELSAASTETNRNLETVIETLRERGYSEEQINAALEQTNQTAEQSVQAIQSAREAEAELAAEREKAGRDILTQARAQAELVALQQDITKFTETDLKNRQEQLQKRIAQSEAELAALKKLDNGSDAVSSQVNNLEQSLAALKEQLALTASEASKTTAAENTRRQKVAEDRKRAETEARKPAVELATTARNARKEAYRNRIKELTEIQLGTRQAEKDTAQKAAEDRFATVQDFYNRERNELVRHYKSLEDIRIDAQRAERDALRSGDIFAIRDIRERTGDRLSDAGRDFAFDRSMRATEFNQQNGGTFTFNITNADPQAVAFAVQQQIQRTFR